MTPGQRAIEACRRAGELRGSPPAGEVWVVLHGARGALACRRDVAWVCRSLPAADVDAVLAVSPRRVLYLPARGRWEVVALVDEC